jgi:hypothetical protein
MLVVMRNCFCNREEDVNSNPENANLICLKTPRSPITGKRIIFVTLHLKPVFRTYAGNAEFRNLTAVSMKSSFMRDANPCSQVKASLPTSCWFLVVLLCDPENESDIPPKQPLNFTKLTVLYPRRYNASVAGNITCRVFMCMLFCKLLRILRIFIKLVKKLEVTK